jgi:hypothetical protein
VSKQQRKSDALDPVLKKDDLDHSKWAARVHTGWDIALQVLQGQWDKGRSLDADIDETLDIANANELDETYLSMALFTQPKWVEVSNDLVCERAVLICRVKQFLKKLEDSVGEGAMVYSPETDLVRSWPEDVIIEAYKLGRMLSDKPTLRRLAGYSVRTGPIDSTAARRKKVAVLWPMRHDQVRRARKRYTANKNDDGWRKIVKDADPQLPEWLIDELPNRSGQMPQQLTARWLGNDLSSTEAAILKDVKELKKSRTL